MQFNHILHFLSQAVIVCISRNNTRMEEGTYLKFILQLHK